MRVPTPPVEAPAGPHVFRALRHRNFRLFCVGQMISLCGTWMQNVAQTWLIYRLTRSELLMGLTNFCLHAPIFALAPVGGLISDRRSRHRIVVVCQALSMLQALALAALTLAGRIEVWHVLALAVLLGIINAFDMPARQSLLIELAGRDDLLNAISLNSSMFNAARVVGPAIAGVLVDRLGEGACFLLNGTSFVAVLAGLLAMHLAPVERSVEEPPWEHLVDGFRYAWQALPIRHLLELLAVATIASVPVLVLMPFFAADILGRGSQGLGALLAAMGVGALSATLSLARRPTTHGLVNVVRIGAAGLGASLLLFAMSRQYYLSLAIMLGVGFSSLRQMAATNTLIQSLIPDDYRGRIMSMYTMTVVGLGPFGSLVAGALAQRFGAPATVTAGGVACLLASALLWSRIGEIERPKRGEISK